MTAARASDLISRGVLVIGDGYRAKNSELGADGLPFARVPQIVNGFDFAGCDRVLAEVLPEARGKIAEPGDVVITTKGTVGVVRQVTEATERFVYSPQTSFWRSARPGELDPRYLHAWLRSPSFKRQAGLVQDQTDMAPYISLRDQRAMEIQLPPIEDQRAIGRAIGLLDDKIDLNRRLCRTLEDLAEAVFRARFIDFDDADELVESEIGWIPLGWRAGSLEEVARYVNGGAYTKHASGSGRMILRIADLNSGPGPSTRYGEVAVPRDQEARFGDVLFAWSGSLGIWWWTGDPAIVNQHIFNCRPRNGYPAWFIYWSTREFLPAFRERAADKATTMGHIKRDDLRSARVAVPPPSAIAAADHVLRLITERWLLAARETRTVADLRDSLLPKLISGEVRLGDTEAVR